MKGGDPNAPLSVHDFRHILAKYRVRSRCGIAVSGGVDSLVLAFLASQLKLSTLVPFFSIAFIVNHRSRPNSLKEIKHVQSLVSKWGMRSEILDLPPIPNDQTSKTLERTWRDLRYRVLAEACINNRLDDLLTAHHADDQVETFFMRLLMGSRSWGLAGMDSVSPVPGGISREAQDLKLVRPFLGITKARLITTAKYSNINWLEDPTNADPSYTNRNAIRLFLSNQSVLPLALQTNRIIPLLYNLSAERKNAREKIAELLQQTKRDVNIFTGSLDVMFPRESLQTSDRLLVRYLTIIANIATPYEVIKISSMDTAVDIIFRRTWASPNQFTAGGLLWTLQSEVRRHWKIERQPFDNKGTDFPTLTIISNGKSSQYRLRLERPDKKKGWYLWDNRFWIRIVYSITPSDVYTIRAWQPQDSHTIISSIENSHRANDPRLKEFYNISKGKSRFTLPVMEFQGRVVALPSLGLSFLHGLAFRCYFKNLPIQPTA